MAYRIRLTPKEIIERTDEINRNSKHIKNDISELSNLLNALRATFIGETSTSFFRDFHNACSNLEKWDEIVNSYAVEIRKVADNMEQADKSLH